MDNSKNVETLGQVFTPEFMVDRMISMIKNHGRTLEPSCGDGMFFNKIDGCVGIEIDKKFCPEGALCMDFFDYPITEKFDTIIGNPPYVAYKEVCESTKHKLDLETFSEKTNLYVFFMMKCLDHLKDGGEMIFIVPREFMKSTSSIPFNKRLYKEGTITEYFETGDSNVFNGFSPNCIVFRYEKGNFDRTSCGKEFVINSTGFLYFMDKNDYPLLFSDLFFVKVGGVSGMDSIFANDEHGNENFVCSETRKTGKLKRMIYNVKTPYLEQYKETLINRKIKDFTENDWWMWGRDMYHSDKERIYVNCKTRIDKPFFINSCKNYDGSVLAIFPKKRMDIEKAVALLNDVDWETLGFVCDGRYMFSQKSLETTFLPKTFYSLIEK